MSLESFWGMFLFCPTVLKAVLSSDPVEDIGLFAASGQRLIMTAAIVHCLPVNEVPLS